MTTRRKRPPYGVEISICNDRSWAHWRRRSRTHAGHPRYSTGTFTAEQHDVFVA